MKQQGPRRALLIGKWWVQAAALVFVFGFFVLGLLAYRTYAAQPPIPERVVRPDGMVLFTGRDILDGQSVFLRNGLMQYGSIFGHGAYLGPDFTADYLRRSALIVQDLIVQEDGDTRAKTAADVFKTNRFDSGNGQLLYTASQARAFERLVDHYTEVFSDPTTRRGLRPSAITDGTELRQLTAFFSWTAWAASARRPGADYSYTNNWPPEHRVGNIPTAAMVIWSMLSLAALLGGIGLLFAAYGRWGRRMGWHGRDQSRLSFRPPRDVQLTPAQRSTAYFFLVVMLLFLIQATLGGASQHYRAELSGFFGLDLGRWLPFNLARTWHLQLAIFWVATSYLAAGIFLAPMIAEHEPPRQHWLAYGLLGALVIVVLGSLVGEYAGIHGLTSSVWFGNQGFEYIELGRFWQVLLIAGLLFWVAMLYRAMRRRLRSEHLGNMPWLFLLAALAIPAFYAVGLLARQDTNFTTSEFWRFWVVHLWVEDFLELFTTISVAYIFVLLGVVSERVGLLVVYLDVILYSVGGVIGTMHHLYFSGEPAEHMALGAFFSAAEVIPLTFLTVESWTFLSLGSQRDPAGAPFPHRWAVMFLVSVGFWNFLGAGVFGFLINLPIVSYYEIGTALTSNHGHAAMMGVYGMLAVGLALFALRYLVPEERWSDRLAQVSFWSLNGGLAWMVFATLFPIGVIQLHQSVSKGYYEARSLEFFTNETHAFFEWLRLPGDAVFIAGGILPLLVLVWRGVRHRRAPTSARHPRQPLFTEVGPAPGG